MRRGVVAAFVVSALLLLTGAVINPSITLQSLIFLASGTGATPRPVMSKLRDVVSVKDFGATGDGVTDDTTAIQAAINVGASGGYVWVPVGTYKITATLTTPTGWGKLQGAGMDASGTVLAFTNAGDGVQLAGNWTIEDVNIQTSNAGAGIGLRFSGLNQDIGRVQLTRSGSGVWSKGIQNLGAVTTTLRNAYTNSNACTTGLDILPNGSNAVGNFNVLNSEIRAVTTGVHAGGSPGCLSCNFYGGAVEGSGSAGVLVDGGSPAVSFFGTHFESNTTDDVKWTTGGSLTMSATEHPGGTTNLLNCPDATCTARVRLLAVTGNGTTQAVILGNTVGASQIIGSKLRGAAVTLGLATNVMRWGNTSFDATTIKNVIGDDGSGSARLFMQGAAGSNETQFSNATSGTFNAFHNGIGVYTMDGSGVFGITTRLVLNTVLQANLGTPANGTLYYCSDCNTASACTAGGAGAFASRQAGAWKCL